MNEFQHKRLKRNVCTRECDAHFRRKETKIVTKRKMVRNWSESQLGWEIWVVHYFNNIIATSNFDKRSFSGVYLNVARKYSAIMLNKRYVYHSRYCHQTYGTHKLVEWEKFKIFSKLLAEYRKSNRICWCFSCLAIAGKILLSFSLKR